MRNAALLAVAALVLAALPARAQETVPLPQGVAERIAAVLGDPATDLREGGGTLAAGESVEGSLAAVGGDLAVAGSVGGDVVVINGSLRLEAGARVDGEILVVGGEVDTDPDARIGGDIVAFGTPIPLCRTETGISIDTEGCEARGGQLVAAPVEDAVDEAAFDDESAQGGFAVETDGGDEWAADGDDEGRTSFVVAAGRSYNRVEGLPIRFGPAVETRGSNPTRVRALAIFRTEQGPELGPERWGYDARAEQFLGGHEAVRIGARLYSVIDPIEGWHLTDLENSLSTFFLHRDYRDHYEREGWSAYTTWAPVRSPVSATLEYRRERHRSLAPGSPWTIFDNDEPWRGQPLAGQGRLDALVANVEVDTRSESWDPSAGWFVRAEVEQALDSRLVRPAGLSPDPLEPATWVLDPLSYGDEWTAATVDIRRYNRISPTSRLNLRLAAGGSLSGDPLPSQRQHAFGGEGSLPGFGLFELDCGARRDSYRRGAEIDDPTWFPRYGCDGFAVFQAEWRSDIPFSFTWGHGDDDEDEEGWSGSSFSSLTADFGWAVFVDAATGWSEDAPDEPLAADVGAGITFGDFGFYAAVPIGESHGRGGLNFFIRLAPRF